jgi:ribosomal protein S18 acetylase RimI-like enzyme
MVAHDLEAVVAIDAQASGRRRPKYFELMLKRALMETDMQVSLVAELDARPVGFIIGSIYFGEFGILEPAATLETISVDPKHRGRGVATALMRQFRLNLAALRVSSIRTEVSWDRFDLLAFLDREGFAPGRRLCLEIELDPTAPTVSRAEG